MLLKYAARSIWRRLSHRTREFESINQSRVVTKAESKSLSKQRSARLALLAGPMLAMSVLLSTASVSGSGKSGQQTYIPPVRTSFSQVSASEFKAQTRSAVDLPSKRYRVAVENQASVHDLGAIEPGR